MAKAPTSADSATADRPAGSALAVVYLTVFLDLLGFGIILPQLPFIALKFGASGAWVGALLASFSIAQLFGAAILGRLSDRWGRRPVMLISLVGSCASFVATGFSTTLWQLMISRALAGLFGGSIATAQAYVADVTKPEERARYMGLIGASIGMGFVLGPFLGAEMARYGFSAASFVAAGLSLIDLGMAALFLKEPPRSGSPRVRITLPQALAQPDLGRLLGAAFVTSFAFVGMEATFALLAKQRFNLGPAAMGRIFAGLGVVLAVVQGGIVGRLARRFGERRVALLGSILLAISMGSIPWAPMMVCLSGVMFFVAAGQGLLLPSLSTLTSRRAPPNMQGGVLGVSQSLGAGARAVGPVLAGALFDRDVRLPYVLSALLVVGVTLALATMRDTSAADNAAR